MIHQQHYVQIVMYKTNMLYSHHKACEGCSLITAVLAFDANAVQTSRSSLLSSCPAAMLLLLLLLQCLVHLGSTLGIRVVCT
jgi:hypothetical protein